MAERSAEPAVPAVGDWVLVWGQVVGTPAHPDDVVVEFFSHNEQWSGHVDRERVERADMLPEFAGQCLSLRQVEPNVYVRCDRHQQHGESHRSGEHEWVEDSETEVIGR